MENNNQNILEIKVGLETHLNLNLKEKLFCNCLANLSTCETCTARPGFFPKRINPEAVKKVILLCKILDAKINFLSFYRKHYDYYDLLNGYQLSQSPYNSIGQQGKLSTLDNELVTIQKIILEEDPAATEKNSINCKRAGCAIIEVVTAPEFEGFPKQVCSKVARYLKTLKTLALELDLCPKSKTMKTDVNISLKNLNYRYEIKNLDSIGSIKKAIILSFEKLKKEEEDPEEQKNTTYHYKNNKLTKSREKQQYFYLKQPNLPSINTSQIELKLKKHHTTYGLKTYIQDYTKAQKIKNKHNSYYILKKMAELSRVKNLELVEILELLKRPYSELLYYLKNYDKDCLEEENYKNLENKVYEIFKLKKLSFQDLDKKSNLFIECIKEIKKELVDEKIKFNYAVIYEELKKILNNKYKE